MIIRKSMSHWFRFSLILLLMGLLLPASPALAQDGDPGKKPRIVPNFKDEQVQTAATVSSANLIQDPSFEASFSSSAYWKQSSTNSIVICNTAECGNHDTAKPRTGSNWVWFGGMDFTEPGDVSPEIGDVYQNVTFPASSCKATLQFYFWIGEARSGSDANDNFRLLVDGLVLFASNATQRNSYPSYTLVSVDVSGYANGAVHKVEFDSKTSNQLVSFNLDDVSLVTECPVAVKGDFNGDRKKDVAVFRPSESRWYIGGIGVFPFGTTGDTPVVGDYNGDLKADIAVFRPSEGRWYIGGIGVFPFGTTGDTPVVGDYNGDGKDDIAIFRPSEGRWYIGGIGVFPFGTTDDVPVVGDYNGDGKDDIAIFRPSEGRWYIGGIGVFPFGTTGDVPVVGDYNGDGKDDIAVFRPSEGLWYIGGIGVFPFGATGDVPVVGDYDGDGKDDIAVFRPSTGSWFIGGVGSYIFGTAGDIPI